MRLLYHLWLSPFSRKVRLVLGEKNLSFEMRLEKVWERRHDFLALNPAGKVPVLVENDGTVLSDSVAICEYLEEAYPDPALICGTLYDHAEIRRIAAWFDEKFFREVGLKLLYEKVIRRFLGMGAPDSEAVRAGHTNIHHHLDYIAYLTERRKWLAGDRYSLADVTAAAHLSCIDYLGDVPWAEHERAKDWYVRVKSRPAFRSLLGDHIAGLPPPKYYADLDF